MGHIVRVPVLDDAVLKRAFEGEGFALLLGLLTGVEDTICAYQETSVFRIYNRGRRSSQI